MNFSMVRYILGWICNFQAGFMLVPAFVALCNGEKEGFTFIQVAICLVIVGILCVMKKPKNRSLKAREGFVCVALGWILLSATGALPYMLSGQIPNYVDAFFETASGYTTTGASILQDASSLSRCMDFWHCFTIWLGGMGILVFMLLVLPLVGGDSIHIMRAESAGPSVGKILPKMRDSVSVLYLIYISLTVIEMIALLISGIPAFDSLCLALSNAGTGGFGVLSTGTMSYTWAQQTILTVFMILFATNFNIYFLLIMRKPKDILKNEELRAYICIIFASALMIAVNIRSMYGSFAEAFHHSTFQVATVMSTTGFSSTDFNAWPAFSKTILVVLMFVGACAGSTCGGIKISRFIIMFKKGIKDLRAFVHPKTVRVLKLDGKKLEDSMVSSVSNYFFTFIVVFIVSLIFVSLEGKTSLTTNFTAVTATLNNIGPGLEIIGPAGNYSSLSVLQKIVLSFDMLIGRLELYPILLLFVPSTWRKN